MKLRHFLDIHELSSNTLRAIIDNAHTMKSAGKKVPYQLRPDGIEDDILLMIFEKPSTRTRISFDVAMRQLGGQTIVINSSDLQLGRGETVADTAKVLSRYGDAIMLRAKSHNTLQELAQYAEIPIINGLTDHSHPCQIIADIMTFEEAHGSIVGRIVTWVGDANNVAVSWIHAAAMLGFSLRIACPEQMRPQQDVMNFISQSSADILIMDDPSKAVINSDCIVTDTWVSMGQTDERNRKKVLTPYSVTQELMTKARPRAIFMHCLPAYRGDEVSADIIDGTQSVVFDEAENRLHAQKAILAWCLGGAG
ncbi:MAG: Ornithine carbamoyltransferase, anabolic [Hyphomicrobiaceae bacterium hypho_1]